MPLTLLALKCFIFCDGEEMETHAVQQEGVSTLVGYVASEAGKVSLPQSLLRTIQVIMNADSRH
jgi:hypothetical protein